MKIQFCGAARTVTGSCYYIDNGQMKFLVDCGAFQGPRYIEDKNRDPFPFDASKIDYVFLTHAHYDHCGRLPLLYKQGFRGKIISTQPTRDIAEIILLDSAKIQREDYERASRRGSDYILPPLYTEEDVYGVMELFEVYDYSKAVELTNDLEFRMRDAGHILGSTMFEFWVNVLTGEKRGSLRKLVFSGDLGQPGKRIIKDPDMISEADYVIVESTYGNRLHKSQDDTVLELLAILKRSQENRSKILIPTFAVERAQELIYELNHFYEKGLIRDLPVFLDSPMAIKSTEVFTNYPEFYDEDTKRLLKKGDDPFEFEGLRFTPNAEDSKRLVNEDVCIIMAGSGMCTGGRIIHHLQNNIENPNNVIIFVGYQVKGTLGRAIVDREKKVRIWGKSYNVKIQINTLGGFSAHADQRDLKYWLRSFGKSPRQVFITHGDEEIAIGFSRTIREELKLTTYVPKMYEVVELN